MISYPDQNPKTAFGVKKPAVTSVPPVAILEIGRVMECGRQKYGLMNWRNDAVSSSVYVNAALRHLLSWWDGETIDPDSGLPHLAHVAACMSIVLDAHHQGTLNDDRPVAGSAADFIQGHSED